MVVLLHPVGCSFLHPRFRHRTPARRPGAPPAATSHHRPLVHVPLFPAPEANPETGLHPPLPVYDPSGPFFKKSFPTKTEQYKAPGPWDLSRKFFSKKLSPRVG